MILKFKTHSLYCLCFTLMACLISCNKTSKLQAEIANINTDIKVERYDSLFATSSVKDLPVLKENYPFMFSKQFDDHFWEAKLKDTLQQQLYKEVKLAFNDFKTTEKEIENLFNHLKYYIPNFKVPRVITTTSYVDYRNRILVTDTLALISTDTYLGSNHEFYISIPKYIRASLTKEQLVVDLATKYAEKYIFQTRNKNLLDEMIYYGKQLYFKDLVLPFKTEAQRIGYTQKQLDWAVANENYIWRYFVERELLFSTDAKLPGRFINLAPFSKFQLEGIDTESPGRIGQYIGWQIVKAYMKQNDTELEDMLNKSAEEIFNNSKFKPRK